jgi:hypothetical protein
VFCRYSRERALSLSVKERGGREGKATNCYVSLQKQSRCSRIWLDSNLMIILLTLLSSAKKFLYVFFRDRIIFLASSLYFPKVFTYFNSSILLRVVIYKRLKWSSTDSIRSCFAELSFSRSVSLNSYTFPWAWTFIDGAIPGAYKEH